MERVLTFNQSESMIPAAPSGKRKQYCSKPFLCSGGFYYGELHSGTNSEMYCALALGTELVPLAAGSFRQVYTPKPIPSSASGSGTHVQNPLSEPVVPSSGTHVQKSLVQGRISRTGRKFNAPGDPWQTMGLVNQPVIAPPKEWNLKPQDVVVKLSCGISFRKVHVAGLPSHYNDLFHVPTGSVNEFMMITRSSALTALAARGTLPIMHSLSITVSEELLAVNQMVAGHIDASSGEYQQGRVVALHKVPPAVYTIEGFLVAWLQLVVYYWCSSMLISIWFWW